MGQGNVVDYGRKIEDMRRQISRDKEERAKRQGQLDTLYDTLESEFGVKTLEEADALLETFREDRRKAEKSLATRAEKLENILKNKGAAQ